MANVGMRIKETITRPDPGVISRFKDIPVANIGDSMNRAFCMHPSIRPYNASPLLGPAFTVKVRPGDNLFLHKALDLAAPGDIIVVEGQGDMSNALIGELMVLWAIKRQLGGLIIDGAIRDVNRLRTVDIPVYAAGVTPAGPYKEGPGEINFPIMCGGVVVNPGDIIVGDADGVVVIKSEDAQSVYEKASAKVKAEQQTMVEIDNGSWDRTWVDAMLAAKGCQTNC
jgi:RraA family protein